MAKVKDLTGERFGRLVVIERDFEYAEKHNIKPLVYWRCKCDCGNYTTVLGTNLSAGKVRSCGCLSKEFLSMTKKKFNRYEFVGDIGIGYCSNTDNKFYFDKEDYDLIKDYCWKEDRGYVKTLQHYYLEGDVKRHSKVIYMHRIICNVDDSKIIIDHRNHNKLDNRKINLRITDSTHNNMNSSICKKNISGHTGVYYRKDNGCWMANIGSNYKTIYLGNFVNKEDAINARKKAEQKYFKEYSYDNSINDSKEYTDDLQQLP